MPRGCSACGVASFGAEGQRAHYQGDWHRYNLKRKLAQLPPLSEAEFDRRRDAALASTQPSQAQSFWAKCHACRKTFASQGALQQHTASKKHKQAAKKSGLANPVEEREGEEADAVMEALAEPLEPAVVEADTPDACFFCATQQAALALPPPAPGAGTQEDGGDEEQQFDIVGNLEHMRAAHGFELPEPEFIVDLEGLVEYLAEKVKLGRACLCCGRAFGSLGALRHHMTATSHARLDLSEGEYEDFYDFTSSYPAHLRGGGDAADGDSEDINWAGVRVTELGELELPDGRLVGHRGLQRYYRQRLRLEDSRPEVLAARRAQLLLANGAAPGSGGSHSGVLSTFVMPPHLRAPAAAKAQQHALRERARIHMQVGVKGNKVLQKHFRRTDL